MSDLHPIFEDLLSTFGPLPSSAQTAADLRATIAKQAERIARLRGALEMYSEQWDNNGRYTANEALKADERI